MTDYLIGSGGWAYFQVPGVSSLEAYSQAFSFVEVNSTFYEIPSIRLAESWRQRVPKDFEFSVRCHKAVTHRLHLEPLEEAFSIFKTMVDICRILESSFLVLVTPPYIEFDGEKMMAVKDFFQSIDTRGVRIVWEVRRIRGEAVSSRLLSLMQDYNIINCADLSKDSPPIDSNVVYTRVFGKGEHNIYQFTDRELLELDERITSQGVDTAVVSFHNVKMYKDAARYKVYKQTERFPPVTKKRGQGSLREVLMEDAEFPASKQELIRDQGWKVVDLDDERRIHAHRLLQHLPDKKFRSVEEVINGLPQAS